MSEQAALNGRYAVSISEPDEAGGAFLFTFVPKGPQQERGVSGRPKRVPQFTAAVRQQAGNLAFDWGGTSDDPGDAREGMEAEIAARLKDRADWMERVSALVGQVEQWAQEMGWATRRVEKRLDDTWIGAHRVHALLMQQDTCRALLEPIGRSSPGAAGVVDLYLMPAYDDIASLYYYDHRWNVHYNEFRGTNAVVPEPKEKAVPLSKEALEKVLAEMRRNAA
jgi:hypothetical protein